MTTPPTSTSASTTTAAAAVPPSPTISALSGKEGVCLIEVVYVEWVWQQPWQRCKQQRTTGSGFVIENKRIITNAHVVSSAIDIRVRLHGSPRRFPAKVLIYAPDVDLALLEIDGDENCQAFFFGGPGLGTAEAKGREEENSPLAFKFASELPALQERVHVVGFPTGGKTICVTEGVVSRIDDVFLAAPGDAILAIQVDSAINPGNSGGPAFNSKGEVTGVAFCKSGSSIVDNIGYVIPADVVRAFLGRCHEDGTYTLSPSVPYYWHSLENHSLRLYHGVPDDVHGILITNVSPTVKDALQKGDVLTKIDGHPIADDGQVTLRGDELIQHRYLLRSKHMDEETVFSVYRNGKHLDGKPCVLRDIPTIYWRWPNVDHRPSYLILGALVLLPMSYGLMTSQNADAKVLNAYYRWGRRWPGDWDDKEGLVLLTNILAHELSYSYARKWRRVVAYNGTPVKSLRHLRDMWEVSCAEAAAASKPTFARIELEQDEDVVFEVKAAIDAQSEILETHQIPKPSEICPPNPKYK